MSHCPILLLSRPPRLLTRKGLLVSDAPSEAGGSSCWASDWIELSAIQEGEINVKVLDSGRKAVVLKKGDDITIFAELCPHMGADLSTAEYCPNDGTLTCSWHGYVCGCHVPRRRALRVSAQQVLPEVRSSIPRGPQDREPPDLEAWQLAGRPHLHERVRPTRSVPELRPPTLAKVGAQHPPRDEDAHGTPLLPQCR